MAHMTTTNANQSEVAQLRERITREHQAAEWAMTGLAEGNLKHRFITRRMEQMGVHQQQLATLIGEEASMAMVCSILDGPLLHKQADK
jgi:hypothetical protein